MKTKTSTQGLKMPIPGFGKGPMLIMKKVYILIALVLFGFGASASCTDVVANFSNTTVCLGSATQFNDSSTTLTGSLVSWSWDFGDSSPVNNTSNPSYTYANAGNYNVSLIVVNNNGCADTMIRSVIVYSTSTSPSSATAGLNAICVGDSTSLTVNGGTLGGGADYKWYAGSCGGTLVGTGSSVVVIPSSTTTYFVRIEGPCNTTSCASVTVTVNPIPVVTASPASQTFCSGNATSIALSSNVTGTTFFWSETDTGVSGSTAGAGSSISQVLTTTGTSAGIAIYTVSASANGCVGSDIIVTVTVNPMDVAAFTYASATYCQSGTNQTPAITGMTGGTFSASPAGLSLNASTGTIDPTTSALGTYTVAYTTNGSCPGSSSVNITITNAPLADFSYPGSPFCQNSTPVFPAFGPGASAGIFTSSPTGLVFVNINTGEVDFASSVPGVYTVINDIYANGSCSAVSDTSIITISYSDDASFVYTSTTFCLTGPDPTPTITGLPGGTFSSTPVGLIIDSITGTISLIPSALGTYTITYSTNGACPNSSSIIFAIIDPPSADFTYSSSTFYQNGNNPFPVLGTGASAGIFNATPSGLVFVNVFTGEIDLMNSAPGTYIVENIISASGCPADTATTTVVISGCSSYTSLGYAYINSPFGACVTDSAAIDFTYLSYANLSGTGSSSVILSWGDGTTDTYVIQHNGSTDSSFYFPLSVHLYNTPGVYTVMLTFYDAGACYNDTIIGVINVSSTSCGNLTGTVYDDTNNDCVQNTGEFGIAGIEVMLTQGSDTYLAWTDSSGNYAFNVPTGAYTIEVINLNAGYTITCSGSLQHATTVSTGTTIENFAILCTGSFDVAVTGISLMDGFYPGVGDAILPHVGILNAACNLTIPGQVIMILEPCIQYSTSGFSWFTNPPDVVIPASTGDTLVWNVSDINNIGSFSYWDYAVNITTCTSAQVGDTACITMMVLPTVGDADPSNNTYTHCFAIGVSYDPNNKEVEPKGTGVQGFIPSSTSELRYTINFQNTGTAVARNIYVLDSIDTDLTINSIEILSASHGIQVYLLPNNTMKFMFADIMLPDSTSDKYHSHGYVTFRIKSNTGLTAGTQIKNTGHIYFDYNEPVATNTVLNTIATPSGINEINDMSLLKVYPNPAKDKLIVTISKNGNSTIVITDVLGKMVRMIKTAELQTQINVSDLQGGIYFIKLTQNNTSYVEKIIISR